MFLFVSCQRGDLCWKLDAGIMALSTSWRRLTTFRVFWAFVAGYVSVVLLVFSSHQIKYDHRQPTASSIHESLLESFYSSMSSSTSSLASPAELPDPAERGESKANNPPTLTSSNVLTAYVEEVNRTEWTIQPLPNRSTAKASMLRKIEFPQSSIHDCRAPLSEQMGRWPVEHPPTMDDPFLPWIHDAFTSADGAFVEIVAQNKRRCQTGPANRHGVMEVLEPQISLFQNSPLQRLPTSAPAGNQSSQEPRFRLASYKTADEDSYMTRFLCQFTMPNQTKVVTLSQFHFDYDYASYRKRYKEAWSKEHGSNKMIHTSQLTFRCPIPPGFWEQQQGISSLQNDNKVQSPLYFNLIPIRTPPRFGRPDAFFQPKYQSMGLVADPTANDDEQPFDADAVYGPNHVLPLIQDSGRWENIPICPPPATTEKTVDETTDRKKVTHPANSKPKEHRLIACLWTTGGYYTRGGKDFVGGGHRRLYEWIHYHKLIGYDHFYLYDNSGAHEPPPGLPNNEHNKTATSLKGIADLFPNDVTYIDWPYKICNNNMAKDESPGERSSQYAAESSCRLRFGPHTDWIGQFDIDEYMVPMGNYSTAKELLDDLDQQDVRIISFPSLRARVRRNMIDEIKPVKDKEICKSPAPCFNVTIPRNVTLLQAFNCDKYLPDQKYEPDPAEKQFYRADYVLQHFIHYSGVTKMLDMNKTEFEKEGFPWHRSRDPRQRVAVEATEGLMIHAKTISARSTAGYHWQCTTESLKHPANRRGNCLLGMPYPQVYDRGNNWTEDGLLYNCHVNTKVENEYVPKLEAAMKAHSPGTVDFLPPGYG